MVENAESKLTVVAHTHHASKLRKAWMIMITSRKMLTVESEVSR